MELIIKIYLLFAATTAIHAYFRFYMPAINEAMELGIEKNFTNSRYIGAFVFTIIAFLVAPLMVLPCIIPRVGESFMKSFAPIVQED